MLSSKHYVTLQAYYPNDKDIIKIIKACSLFPVDNNWKIWTNDNQYFCKIYSKFLIKFSDKLDKKIFDLYHKSSLEQIKTISKVYLELNIDNDKYYWLYGEDFKIRTISIQNNIQINHNPIFKGIELIRILINNLNQNNLDVTNNINKYIKNTTAIIKTI